MSISTKDTILDKNLWEKAKIIGEKVYGKKHSAYKWGYICSVYKNLGGRYKGKKENKGLSRWFKEKWTNQHGTTGYHHKNDVYRPSIRVNKSTPVTWKELKKTEIEKAKREKSRTSRVKKFKSTTVAKNRIS